ncbi:hypothetical protein D9757_002861 [Collybiopsis confluens]|uniref:GRIP domain-containing protein n=1 Tax=Collybiopsis confluens TaxID=2823264 RepID=A0A8H5HVL9_9AGAR|nr:hypothetical protein D9757_002861 [Collybiopsis confluens]
MFTQFRNAVETFAPQPRRSIDSARNERPASPHSATEATSPTATQLAESALSNLRKSFATPPISPHKSRPHKSTLEERLRAAAFTIGDVSGSTTPQPSARASPTPLPVKDHPLSPSSTPLPESPAISSQDPLGVLPVDAETRDVTESSSERSSPISTDVQGCHDEIANTGDSKDTPRVDEVDSTGNEMSNQEDTKPQFLEEQPSTVAAADLVVQTASLQSADEHVGEKVAVVNPPTPVSSTSSTVEELQERLKLVEQRFTDVSTSFKRLQAEKSAADAVLRDLTPLESVRESDAFRDYLKNVNLKVEVITQEDRFEELRDTHRLESRSQSEQIDSLKKQLEESESLLNATQQSSDEMLRLKSESERLAREIAKERETIKEEEEKRVKAISLLKTVRQKLTKAEKEREEALREASALKDKVNSEQAREEEDKEVHRKELASLGAERDRALASLKVKYDKELVAAKERHEREMVILKAELELDLVTVKATHDKEISSKNSRINQLENSLNSVVRDKNSFFEQVQLRQAEVESSQIHLESLQSTNAEFQHQLREHEDRIILLNEQLSEARREHDSDRKNSTTSEETTRLLASTEAKYEAKLAELKMVLNHAEKERNESDAEWSRKLREKNKENERLNRLLGTATKSRAMDEGVVEVLKHEISRLQEQFDARKIEVMSLQKDLVHARENEHSVNARETETDTKIQVLEHQVEEAKARESQLRTNNKNLRDELRKVQTSAALLDRQRNPGVGYWTSRGESDPPASVSPDTVASSVPSGRPSTDKPPNRNEEEEVNLEYLRNVILQFLEHKDMRPNLVRVLSIILHFTPQETRRLIAKV